MAGKKKSEKEKLEDEFLGNLSKIFSVNIPNDEKTFSQIVEVLNKALIEGKVLINFFKNRVIQIKSDGNYLYERLKKGSIEPTNWNYFKNQELTPIIIAIARGNTDKLSLDMNDENDITIKTKVDLIKNKIIPYCEHILESVKLKISETNTIWFKDLNWELNNRLIRKSSIDKKMSNVEHIPYFLITISCNKGRSDTDSTFFCTKEDINNIKRIINEIDTNF